MFRSNGQEDPVLRKPHFQLAAFNPFSDRRWQREHLTAALALWEYIEDSAAWVFGDSIGDPEADTILRQLRLRAEGLTRTEINDLFEGHRRANEIERAITLLTEKGFARCEKVETGGRPVERWVAA